MFLQSHLQTPFCVSNIDMSPSCSHLSTFLSLDFTSCFQYRLRHSCRWYHIGLFKVHGVFLTWSTLSGDQVCPDFNTTLMLNFCKHSLLQCDILHPLQLWPSAHWRDKTKLYQDGCEKGKLAAKHAWDDFHFDSDPVWGDISAGPWQWTGAVGEGAPAHPEDTFEECFNREFLVLVHIYFFTFALMMTGAFSWNVGPIISWYQKTFLFLISQVFFLFSFNCQCSVGKVGTERGGRERTK